LIAQIPQLFSGDIECLTCKDNRIARIVSEPAGETVNGWIITSNQRIKTSLCCFHTIHLLDWSKATDLSLQLISAHEATSLDVDEGVQNIQLFTDAKATPEGFQPSSFRFRAKHFKNYFNYNVFASRV